MSRPPEKFRDQTPPEGRRDAAYWTMCLDRGLTPEEQDAYMEWLAADPRNLEAMRRFRGYWKRLDTLADWRPEHARRPNPDLLAPPRPRPRHWWRAAAVLATAACVVFGWISWQRVQPAETVAAAPRHEDRRLLPDGSTAKLGEDAEIELFFSDSERRIALRRGQAFFMVQRDAARPFVVEAGGVRVRAIGTAFDVRLDARQVDVVVTEGTVAVLSREALMTGDAANFDDSPIAVVNALQQISVPIAEQTAPVLASLSKRDVQERLAWQHGLMTFHQKPLAEIVEELNWINDTQLVLVDEALAATRFSGTIRSDNLAGFVRLLETAFGAQIEPAVNGEIRLRTGGESK